MASSADLTPGNPESGSTPDPARRGRVRLRRAAVMAVPAVGALAGA